MTIALLTFAGIAAVVLGIYWLLLARPEYAEDSAIKRRLRRRPVAEAHRSSVYRPPKQLSEIAAINAVLKRSKGLAGSLELLIQRAGLHWTVGTLLLGSAVAGGVVFEGLQMLGALFVAAAIAAVLAASAPYMYVRHKATKRMERFEELFPEAIGLIIRSLRAGHAFTTGLAMVAEEMTDPVGPEFRTLYDQQNFGMPLEDALKQLAARIPLIDVKFFVTAVLTQRDAGGNLAEVLENLTAVVRDRFKVKRQVRVITAHARISGTVLMLLPPSLAIAILLMAPDQMSVLWTDPIGVRMLIGAVVLQIVGVLVIRRIIDIEY